MNTTEIRMMNDKKVLLDKAKDPDFANAVFHLNQVELRAALGIPTPEEQIKEARKRIRNRLPEDEVDYVPQWVIEVLVAYGKELAK
jgi:hypothetical protein